MHRGDTRTTTIRLHQLTFLEHLLCSRRCSGSFTHVNLIMRLQSGRYCYHPPLIDEEDKVREVTLSQLQEVAPAPTLPNISAVAAGAGIMSGSGALLFNLISGEDVCL